MLKRILHVFVLVITTIGFAYGDTQTIDWYVDGSVYNTTTCTVGGDVNLPTAPTKYGYTFRGWYNYIPLEYIESTGTQYINTGVIPNSATRISMAYMVDGNSSNGFIFGSRTSQTSSDSLGVLYVSSVPRIDFNYGHPRMTCGTMSNVIFDTKIVLNLNANALVLTSFTNNSQILNCANTSQITQGTYPIAIFGFNNANVYDSFQPPLKMYYFQIYQNDVLVRDMIPVLDYNGVPCMFDKVSETFFYNAGTGSFTAGPVISNQ